MRTYARKQPYCRLIDDVQKLCRLCLGKPEEAVPIFTDDSDSVCVALALRIMICVGLEIKREDCLPNTICIECSKELNRYYTFRKKCEKSYQKLKAHLGALKKKELIQDVDLKKELNMNFENKVEQNEIHGELAAVSTVQKDLFGGINFGSDIENNVKEIVKTEIPKETDFNESNTNEGQLEAEDTSSPDLSTYLTTILVESGILVQNDNCLAVADQVPKNLELETGDGSQLTLELEEVDEMSEKKDIREETKVKADESESNENEEKSVFIKYITAEVKLQNQKQNNIVAWCTICNKSFASRSSATRHQREHLGERPHACATCGRRFTQRAVLLRHQLVHDENRPFKCSSCPKSFTQRGALLSHARSHAPLHARPLYLHRCTRCSKVFLHASGLSRHMTMHNGRVYVCGSCGGRYRDKSSLIRHLKNSNHDMNTEAASLVVDADGKGIKASKLHYVY